MPLPLTATIVVSLIRDTTITAITIAVMLIGCALAGGPVIGVVSQTWIQSISDRVYFNSINDR